MWYNIIGGYIVRFTYIHHLGIISVCVLVYIDTHHEPSHWTKLGDGSQKALHDGTIIVDSHIVSITKMHVESEKFSFHNHVLATTDLIGL